MTRKFFIRILNRLGVTHGLGVLIDQNNRELWLEKVDQALKAGIPPVEFYRQYFKK